MKKRYIEVDLRETKNDLIEELLEKELSNQFITLGFEELIDSETSNHIISLCLKDDVFIKQFPLIEDPVFRVYFYSPQNSYVAFLTITEHKNNPKTKVTPEKFYWAIISNKDFSIKESHYIYINETNGVQISDDSTKILYNRYNSIREIRLKEYRGRITKANKKRKIEDSCNYIKKILGEDLVNELTASGCQDLFINLKIKDELTSEDNLLNLGILDIVRDYRLNQSLSGVSFDGGEKHVIYSYNSFLSAGDIEKSIIKKKSGGLVCFSKKISSLKQQYNNPKDCLDEGSDGEKIVRSIMHHLAVTDKYNFLDFRSEWNLKFSAKARAKRLDACLKLYKKNFGFKMIAAEHQGPQHFNDLKQILNDVLKKKHCLSLKDKISVNYTMFSKDLKFFIKIDGKWFIDFDKIVKKLSLVDTDKIEQLFSDLNFLYGKRPISEGGSALILISNQTKNTDLVNRINEYLS